MPTLNELFTHYRVVITRTPSGGIDTLVRTDIARVWAGVPGRSELATLIRSQEQTINADALVWIGSKFLYERRRVVRVRWVSSLLVGDFLEDVAGVAPLQSWFVLRTSEVGLRKYIDIEMQKAEQTRPETS